MGWTTETLNTLLASQEHWQVKTEGDCLTITNDEGIAAFVYAGEQQLLVEALLFPEAAVVDVNALNELVLTSHQMVPLTAICKRSVAGAQYYIAFGSLSADSKESVILEEIEVLFENIDEFLELYSEHLQQESVS